MKEIDSVHVGTLIRHYKSLTDFLCTSEMGQEIYDLNLKFTKTCLYDIKTSVPTEKKKKYRKAILLEFTAHKKHF